MGNTLGRHNHTQPVHTHSFSGQLASTALSGTAAGQKYYDMKSGLFDSDVVTGSADFVEHVENIFPGISSGKKTWIPGAQDTRNRPSSTTAIGHTRPGNTSSSGSHSHSSPDGGTGSSGSHSHSIPSQDVVASNWSLWGIDGGADYAESSAVTGRLDNDRVNGSIASGGDDPTDYTGDAETAPDHLYVRYLIRARQMPLP